MKDYIWIDDVVDSLHKVSVESNLNIVNLASGTNTTNAEIANWLNSQNIETRFANTSVMFQFPKICTVAIKKAINTDPICGFKKLQKWFQTNRTETFSDFLDGKKNG